MKPLKLNSYVAISTVHGWGGFAAKDIRKGGIIEECPYVDTVSEEKHPDQVGAYLFEGDKKNTTMMVLGYGAVYNHSAKCNADYHLNKKKKVLVFYALKNIKKGEEIFTDYGKEYWKSRKKKPH